ncbi:hypothetical protein Fmac_005579 [Flemingia macrophylla]|uniref:Uncharacterized protein n=1 Tax=Flemingia macrophylla TaxID=520843 RepID=A0ABD1N8A9_9FABA
MSSSIKTSVKVATQGHESIDESSKPKLPRTSPLAYQKSVVSIRLHRGKRAYNTFVKYRNLVVFLQKHKNMDAHQLFVKMAESKCLLDELKKKLIVRNDFILHKAKRSLGAKHKLYVKWVLPSRQPDGTKAYKNRALRTPFTKYRFKNNGENFHIKLSVKNKLSKEVSVPEDLVQIQAYLRWERKGKQTYSPEQEKVIGSRNPHNTVKVVFKALNAISN